MAGTKRKHGEDSPSQLYTSKSRSRPSVEARVDPTYGQRSAIPGLDDDTILEGEQDGLSYDDDMDALAYLRSVRQEATGIPNLLVAPKQPADRYGGDIYEDGVGDWTGYYEDGAYYTSDPTPASSDDIDEGETGGDPQLAYFDSILTRFEILREQLAQTPPADAIRKLGKDNPTHVGKLNTEVARWWRWKMRTVDPLPVQIACMGKSTVLRLLGLLTGGTLLKKGAKVEVGVSRWAWGLLARLPERGELSSEEIGVVRELGKRAVLVGMGLREEKNWDEGIREVEAGYEEDDEFGEDLSYEIAEEIHLAMDEEFDDAGIDDADLQSVVPSLQIGPQLPADYRSNGIERVQAPEPKRTEALFSNGNGSLQVDTPGEGKEADDDIAAAKARLLAKLSEPNVNDPDPDQTTLGDAKNQARFDAEKSKWNTRATVDMIITVAGEMFGQRDLLEFRLVWGGVM